MVAAAVEDETAKLRSELAELSKPQLQAYVRCIIAPRSRSSAWQKSIQSLRQDIECILNETSIEKRRYLFLNASELKEEARRRNLSFGRKTKEELMLLLSEQDHNNGGFPPTLFSPDQAIWRDLIQKWFGASFLKPVTGVAKESMKIGHAMEEPLVRNFIQKIAGQGHALPFGDLQWELEYVGSIGIVEQKKDGQSTPFSKAVKDSVDFVGGASNSEDEHLMFAIECKTRTNPRTSQAERDISSTELFVTVRCESDNDEGIAEFYSRIHKYVPSPHEKVQLLHHAFVLGLQHVLLLVGDNAGQLVHAVFIVYGQQLLDHYKEILKYVYDMSLDWLYSCGGSMPTNSTLLEILTHCQETSMDLQTFKGLVSQWTSIQQLKLPLP